MENIISDGKFDNDDYRMGDLVEIGENYHLINQIDYGHVFLHGVVLPVKIEDLGEAWRVGDHVGIDGVDDGNLFGEIVAFREMPTFVNVSALGTTHLVKIRKFVDGGFFAATPKELISYDMKPATHEDEIESFNPPPFDDKNVFPVSNDEGVSDLSGETEDDHMPVAKPKYRIKPARVLRENEFGMMVMPFYIEFRSAHDENHWIDIADFIDGQREVILFETVDDAMDFIEHIEQKPIEV